MPVMIRTSRSHSAFRSIHYITTGQYRGGRFNQPHITGIKNGVKQRNYLLEGINAHTNPHSAVKDFGFFLNQNHTKVQATNLVLSFGHELNWCKPKDLILGHEFVHSFVHEAFPNSPVYTGYQLDNTHAMSHVHLCVCNVDMKTGKGLSAKSIDIYRLRRIANYLTNVFNKRHPDHHLIQMKNNYGSHRIPTDDERLIIKRILPIINNENITTPEEFRKVAKRHGVIAHFKVKGHLTGRKYHHHYEHYINDGLVLKVAGKGGSYGFHKASKLSEFIPSLNIKLLKHQFYINRLYTSNAHKRARLSSKKSITRYYPIYFGDINEVMTSESQTNLTKENEEVSYESSMVFHSVNQTLENVIHRNNSINDKDILNTISTPAVSNSYSSVNSSNNRNSSISKISHANFSIASNSNSNFNQNISQNIQ